MKYLIEQSQAIVTEEELKESYRAECDDYDYEDYDDWKGDMIEMGLLRVVA